MQASIDTDRAVHQHGRDVSRDREGALHFGEPDWNRSNDQRTRCPGSAMSEAGRSQINGSRAQHRYRWNTMKMIRTMAAVAAVASVLAACGGGGTSDVGKELGLTNPEIHFIHAIPGGPAVDFLVNGTAPSGQTNISYKGVTNLTNINTGSTTVAYSNTGTTTALASGNFPDVAKGHEYTVLALPGATAPDIGLIDDPFDKGL